MIVKDDEQGRALALDEIAAGGVVAFRTDTFYGLGVNPFDADAVRKLIALKRREEKPVLIIISDAALVERFFARRTKLFEALSAQYWPGALTIVERAQPTLPSGLTAGAETIGVRLPDDEAVRDFVCSCGGALTATSANRTGEAPARTAAEAARYFPSIIVLDGGDARGDKPSTVVEISAAPRVRLIREGAVSFDALQKALHAVESEKETEA